MAPRLRQLRALPVALLLAVAAGAATGTEPSAPQVVAPELFTPVVVASPEVIRDFPIPDPTRPRSTFHEEPEPVVVPVATPKPPAPRVPTVADARAYAKRQIGAAQFACLDPLWEHESGWRTRAENRSSGAYGIPQALPGRKMATAGADWRINPVTQVKWGLRYIKARYGTACGAWSFWRANRWY